MLPSKSLRILSESRALKVNGIMEFLEEIAMQAFYLPAVLDLYSHQRDFRSVLLYAIGVVLAALTSTKLFLRLKKAKPTHPIPDGPRGLPIIGMYGTHASNFR